MTKPETEEKGTPTNKLASPLRRVFRPRADDDTVPRRNGPRRIEADNIMRRLFVDPFRRGPPVVRVPSKKVSFNETVEVSTLSMHDFESTSSVRSLFSGDSSGQVDIGPFVALVTSDAAILWSLSVASAANPTYQHWTTVVEGRPVPLSVVAVWLLVAFCSGLVVSYARVQHKARTLLEQPVLATPIVEPDHLRQQVVQEEIVQRHRLVTGLLQLTSPLRLCFSSAVAPVRRLGDQSWTNLAVDRRLLWQRTVDPTLDRENRGMMMTLLQNPHLKRLPRAVWQREPSAVGRQQIRATLCLEPRIPTAMGQFVNEPEPVSLKDFVVLPMMELRGMDVFMTQEPQGPVATHPWLIEQGLRDVPTMIVNCTMSWGLILVYFELPSWVDRLSGLEETDEDEEEVIALKRWLNGDDEYRNAHLRFVPSLVDGPTAIRMVAPSAGEVYVNCQTVPVRYHKVEAEETVLGRKLCPALEVEFDCLFKPAVRTVTGIAKRNLKRISLDTAFLIGKPEHATEEEPEACLGMFRLNHIDAVSCPMFPDRVEMEANVTGSDPDIMRAGMVSMRDPAEWENG